MPQNWQNVTVKLKYRDQIGLDWIVQGLTSRQHSIGYMGDGFYRSKDPTNIIEVLKEKGKTQETLTTKYSQKYETVHAKKIHV